MKTTSGLTVRQHERAGIHAPVELRLCDEHAGQVRFSPQSGAADRHVILGVAVDISPGGMGVQSRHFLPRMSEGTVRLVLEGEIVLEQRFKVRRVYLVGREPRYQIGLAFIDPPQDIEQMVQDVQARLGLGLHDTGGPVHA